MEKTAWTNGPWWTDGVYDEEDHGCSIIAANPEYGPMPGNPTRGQVAFATAILPEDANTAQANAYLIAAAPAMAEALENLLKWVKPIAGDNRDPVAEANELKTVADAEAALSLARGETK